LDSSPLHVAPEPRLALLIGNAAYKASPLRNPVNDVRLMESVLKESGFTVIKAENASMREMRRLVREFGDRLKADGGVGLFYFAGRGDAATLDLAFWESVKSSNYPADLQAYLSQYPDGLFASPAKARLA
jgi:uncharacterized caspase-like protein